ncbi:DUF4405 domain-containing protein [bacterium]|nr:DUF4405 domain-containing protein [bacterium]
MTWGFIVMAFTGLILFIVPAGRIAQWVNWTLFGLTKDQWTQIHVLFCIVFLIGGGFHIYFNWKPLIRYFYSKAKQGVNLGKEIIISLVISVVLIIAAIAEISPFNYVFEFSTFLKDSWIISEAYEPPIGHAELLSLKSFTKKQGIDLNEALSELEKANIKVAADKDSLGKIAIENKISPMAIYQIIQKLEKTEVPVEGADYTPEKVEEILEGKGVGRKNVEWLATEYKIDMTEVEKRLAKNNVTYTKEETFHDISDRYSVGPMDIAKIIMVQGYTL